jgi:hypothetical protein
MRKLLQRLISIFREGETFRSGEVVARDLRFASELKTIANWERKSPEVYELWSLLSKEQRVAYLRDVKQGKLTAAELEQRLNKQLDRTAGPFVEFRIKAGIPWTATELKEIDRLTDEIAKTLERYRLYGVNRHYTFESEFFRLKKDWDTAQSNLKKFTSKTGQTYERYVGNPWAATGTKVKIHVITRDVAKTLRGSRYKPTLEGWASNNNIYMIQDGIMLSTFNGSSSKQRTAIVDLLTHEIAHTKDPRTSASLKTYNSKNKNVVYDTQAEYKPYFGDEYNLSKGSAKNWLKNYFYHDIEIVANFAPVLKYITTNTEKIVKRIGKQQTIKALDEIAQWLATGTPPVVRLSSNALEILGKISSYKKLLKLHDPISILTNPEFESIYGFFSKFKEQNPKAYKQVINKTARQIEDLKGQVKRTRNLTPESVIKYKVLI